MQDDLPQKLEGLSKIGYKEMTVAELISGLAGLPPMMEVYADCDGISSFVNGAEIEQVGERGAPFLRIKCSEKPIPRLAPAMSYEEEMARQKNTAIELGRRLQEAAVMPEAVD